MLSKSATLYFWKFTNPFVILNDITFSKAANQFVR